MRDRFDGTRTLNSRIHRWLAIGAGIALIAFSTAAHCQPVNAGWGVAQLMQTLAQRGPESARFVEKKYLAILDKPVESSGELRYVPPDRLEKRTLKPKPESLVLAGDQLSVERG